MALLDGSEVEIESARINEKEKPFRIGREGETIVEDHSAMTKYEESIGPESKIFSDEATAEETRYCTLGD